MLKDDNFYFVNFNEVASVEVERSFAFYFGDGKSNFRFSGFMYDYGFDLVQSESFIYIDFGFKHHIKFFLPFFYSFFPFFSKSSSLLFWKEMKYLLYKSLPINNLDSFFLDNLYFKSNFPLIFYNFSMDLSLGLQDGLSEINADILLEKNIINKLSYDTSLDIDNHVSLNLSSGGVPLTTKFGRIPTSTLSLTMVSDFHPGASFFLSEFDNVKSRLARPYFFNLPKLNFKKINIFLKKRLLFRSLYNTNFYSLLLNYFEDFFFKISLKKLNLFVIVYEKENYNKIHSFIKYFYKSFYKSIYRIIYSKIYKFFLIIDFSLRFSIFFKIFHIFLINNKSFCNILITKYFKKYNSFVHKFSYAKKLYFLFYKIQSLKKKLGKSFNFYYLLSYRKFLHLYIKTFKKYHQILYVLRKTGYRFSDFTILQNKYSFSNVSSIIPPYLLSYPLSYNVFHNTISLTIFYNHKYIDFLLCFISIITYTKFFYYTGFSMQNKTFTI